MENNLDYLCAESSQRIPENKDDETIIQKSLGVLQEDGLFAFAVFLESQKDEKANKILKEIEELLNKVGLTEDANNKNLKQKILEITEDLDKTFLTKDLIERTLIYARYHAKALGD